MTHKFARGDVVRVSHYVINEDGWNNVWVNKMNHALGYTFKVHSVDEELGIELELCRDYPDDVFHLIDNACDFRFPPGALELVSQAVTEVI